MKLAARALTTQPSATKAMTRLAHELIEKGREIITLSQGEPDFPTPAHVCAAAKRAIDRGETRYTDVPGTRPLREAIARKFLRDHALEVPIDGIQVACGAKQVIYNALQATVEVGDEVIVPTPAWVSYTEMVHLAGATPVTVPCNRATGFKLTPAALRSALTPATRWLMLNSPCNPSGVVYTATELTLLGTVLLDYPQVMVMADDIYEKIRYVDDTFATMANAVPALGERVLTVNGVSKAYAMTGWRVGYGVGRPDLIKAMNTIQSQSTSHTSSISQAAAVAALDGPTDFLGEYVAAFRRRRDAMVTQLNAMQVFLCDAPDGAFYVFPSCAALLGRAAPSGRKLQTDADVAMWLLEDAGVAAVPGSAFGASGHIRFSYATADEQLDRALRSMERAVARLQ